MFVHVSHPVQLVPQRLSSFDSTRQEPHSRDGDSSGDRSSNWPGRDFALAPGGPNSPGPDPEPDKAAGEMLHAGYCHGKPQLPGRLQRTRILKYEAIHGSVGIDLEELGHLGGELAGDAARQPAPYP